MTVPDSADYPFAELDAELHECPLPALKWGRIYTCACGCVWEVVRTGFVGIRSTRMRWALTHDPDRKDA